MSGGKQFNSRIDEGIAERVSGLDMTNREAMEQAFEMLLRAHGMTDEASLESEIKEIDNEMRRVRREANETLADLAEKREELVETLEWRREQKDLVAMTVEEIAEGLASNPNQNLRAYQEQVDFLIAHGDGPVDRDGVVARLQEYASSNDVTLSPRQLYPNAWDETMGSRASTDGSGDTEDGEGVEYGGFNYGDEE